VSVLLVPMGVEHGDKGVMTSALDGNLCLPKNPASAARCLATREPRHAPSLV